MTAFRLGQPLSIGWPVMFRDDELLIEVKLILGYSGFTTAAGLKPADIPVRLSNISYFGL
jgi:hypothetical protein